MSGTILILEDDAGSRFAIRAVLEHNGFDVLEASDESEAVKISAEYEGPIDVVIADVMLRSERGPRTAKQLREVRPELPFLFISGFPLETLLNRGLLRSDEFALQRAAFLRKPFTAGALRQAIARLTAR